MESQEVEPPDGVITNGKLSEALQNSGQCSYGKHVTTTGEVFVLTATGPSTLIKGTFGKTTDPSGMEYTSTSEQSTSLR
jgi:hypothetical protein